MQGVGGNARGASRVGGAGRRFLHYPHWRTCGQKAGQRQTSNSCFWKMCTTYLEHEYNLLTNSPESSAYRSSDNPPKELRTLSCQQEAEGLGFWVTSSSLNPGCFVNTSFFSTQATTPNLKHVPASWAFSSLV